MRTVLTLLLLCSTALMAQRGRGGEQAASPVPPGPPKNLRVLPADVNIQQTMAGFRAALGVQCTYCHAQGDYASDENEKKSRARNMLRITADVNAAFPDGKRHVTCYTCHRGEAIPGTAPPEPGSEGRGRGRGRGPA